MTQLETIRLILRPLATADAPHLAELAADYDVAAGTLSLPHPYAQSDAEQFITRFSAANTPPNDHVFALTRRAEGRLIGVVGLHEMPEFRRAEIGYWLGKPFWNQGYASEAARRLVRFGFEALELNRIYAACYAVNAASARVMQKAGMLYEGTLRQHYVRFDTVHDAHFYGILREDWERQNGEGTSER